MSVGESAADDAAVRIAASGRYRGFALAAVLLAGAGTVLWFGGSKELATIGPLTATAVLITSTVVARRGDTVVGDRDGLTVTTRGHPAHYRWIEIFGGRLGQSKLALYGLRNRHPTRRRRPVGRGTHPAPTTRPRSPPSRSSAGPLIATPAACSLNSAAPTAYRSTATAADSSRMGFQAAHTEDRSGGPDLAARSLRAGPQSPRPSLRAAVTASHAARVGRRGWPDRGSRQQRRRDRRSAVGVGGRGGRGQGLLDSPSS